MALPAIPVIVAILARVGPVVVKMVRNPAVRQGIANVAKRIASKSKELTRKAVQQCKKLARGTRRLPEEIADEGIPFPGKPVTGTGIWQYLKPGGIQAARRDFDRMRPTQISIRPNGTQTGTLPDGRTVNLHPSRFSKAPTLESTAGAGQPRIKIRYGP